MLDINKLANNFSNSALLEQR